MNSTQLPQDKIINATQSVLASKKVSGTRMRQIAESAGISPGTLHYYFPSKTGLLLAVLDKMQGFFESRQKQLLSHHLDAQAKIRLFSVQQRQLLRDDPQVEEIFLDFWGQAMVDRDIRRKILSMYAAWRRDISRVIQDGVESGEFKENQATVAPYLFVALLEGTALQYLLGEPQIDLEAVFEAINILMVHWLRGAFTTGLSSDQPDGELLGRAPYPTDISEADWEQIKPLLSPAKEGGRPRTADLREIVNALSYIYSCGCSWRMLPHDLPGWQTVYAYYRKWSSDGSLDQIGAILGIDFSRKAGEA